MNAKRFGLNIATVAMVAVSALGMAGQSHASALPGMKGTAPDGACANTLVLNPDADTTIYGGGGVVGAGSFRYLTVQNPEPRRTALLHFNLAAIPTTVQVCNARLALDMFSASGAGIENISAQYAMSAWSECCTVWPGPALGPMIATTSVGLAPGWYAWTVTSAVNNWRSGLTNNGFALTGQAGALANRVFYSREMLPTSLQPQLVINY